MYLSKIGGKPMNQAILKGTQVDSKMVVKTTDYITEFT